MSESGGDTARIDYTVQAGETYLLKLSGDSSSVDLTLANLVDAQGTEIQIFGTSQADQFEFVSTQSYELTINGIGYHFDNTQYETIVFTGGEGDDTATLTGSPDSEIARFFPDHGTFGENGFLVTVNDVAAITAHGGGGDDADPTYEIMARKFDEYKFEGKHGGYDRAKLHHTVLNDHAQAEGNSARLYANNGEMDLLYEVAAFEWVRLYASSGEDSIDKDEPLEFDLLYDSSEWDEL